LVPVPEFRLAFLYPDAAVIELPRWQQPDSRKHRPRQDQTAAQQLELAAW